MKQRKHWGEHTFEMTSTDELGRYGYCQVCKADMQIFDSDGLVRHYHSHGTARALGLWGQARSKPGYVAITRVR